MKKTVIFIVSVAMLAAILCACGKPKQEQALKIGLLGIDDSVPFFVAEQEGLFEKYGVDAELLTFGSGQAQSAAMEAGELDCMMTDMVVQALLMKAGTDVRTVSIAFGNVPDEGRFLVVSAPGSGITTPEDLIGATVAISDNTMMDYLFEQFEDIEGLDRAQITTVSMPDLMLRLEALLDGSGIDAAILPDPLASYAVSGGANIVIDDTLLGVNLSQSVIIANGSVIDNNSEAVAGMLSAVWEAMTLLNENPEQYRALCLETAHVPEEISANYPSPFYSPGTLPSGENVSRVMDWMASRDLIDQAFAYDQVVDNRYIP